MSQALEGEHVTGAPLWWRLSPTARVFRQVWRPGGQESPKREAVEGTAFPPAAGEEWRHHGEIPCGWKHQIIKYCVLCIFTFWKIWKCDENYFETHEQKTILWFKVTAMENPALVGVTVKEKLLLLPCCAGLRGEGEPPPPTSRTAALLEGVGCAVSCSSLILRFPGEPIK